HRHIARDAQLILVGPRDRQLLSYEEALYRAVVGHGVSGAVHLTGPVSLRQLKTYYSHASVFWCASEHEGFCVPLVEAMRFEVPIVAYGRTAVRDTLGETGILWNSPNPALLADG